jgi:NhaP-type Na+/H+ or K+/H+ antiporter
MNSEVLLAVFLPGLIMAEAIEIDIKLFLQALPQLIILAFPLVLMGTVLTTLIATYIFPYGWTWPLAAILGSILSSTDPVAVAAVLKEAGGKLAFGGVLVHQSIHAPSAKSLIRVFRCP